MELRVLTLNCWGIPFPIVGSLDRVLRMKKIANKLDELKLDFVALQEVWNETDFDQLRSSLITAYPHSFYFHSGVIGSGVCVFSRYPIMATLMHRYTLNGYPHHVHRGDWFGGKVVGLVKSRILVDDREIAISLYATHIHAEYNRVNDIYISHRTMQAFELAEFVRHSSMDADLVLVMGDLNLEPEDNGFSLVVDFANLKDAWVEAESTGDDVDKSSKVYGMTSDRPDNCYTVPHMRISCPNGKRIDYVLYRSPFAITVKECKVMMNGIENSNGLNYSDHSAVFARLNVDLNSKSNIPEYTSRQHTTLQKSLNVVEAGIGAMKASGWFNIAALFAIAVVWLAVFDLESHHPPFMIPVMLLRLLLTVMFIYWLWTGVIGAKMERKALLAVKSHMDIALKQFK